MGNQSMSLEGNLSREVLLKWDRLSSLSSFDFNDRSWAEAKGKVRPTTDEPEACGPVNAERVDGDGFQPVDPWKSPELTETRRNLPHLQAPESTYFVTFRCREGLLLSEPEREIVMAAIRHWDSIRIELNAAVVMPNHVHLIFRLLRGLSLGAVLQSIKGYSARSINALRARKGPLWLDESFDHVIRHRQELEEKTEYIRQNPITRGLTTSWHEYRWLWIKE
jgi:REP element-mobilizing transposase RayT